MKLNPLINLAVITMAATFGLTALAQPPQENKTVVVPSCCKHYAQAVTAGACPLHGPNCPHHPNDVGMCAVHGAQCKHYVAAQAPTPRKNWWCFWRK